MDEITRQKLRDIADASRALTRSLDHLLADASVVALPGGAGRADSAAIDAATDKRNVWDPEMDAPHVAPKVVGTREEQDWCCLTYLGGIYAINKRYGRGASKDEVREYAMRAGYRDGRAVTAWSKGNGATQNDEDRQRWVNANGVDIWVKRLASKLGLTLPDDLAEPWEAPDFD